MNTNIEYVLYTRAGASELLQQDYFVSWMIPSPKLRGSFYKNWRYFILFHWKTLVRSHVGTEHNTSRITSDIEYLSRGSTSPIFLPEIMIA